MRLTRQGNQFLRYSKALAGLLIIALLAASVHVSLHDWNNSATGLIGHQDCQLTQLPVAILPPPALPILSFGLMPLVVISVLCLALSAPIRPWQARAPPL